MLLGVSGLGFRAADDCRIRIEMTRDFAGLTLWRLGLSPPAVAGLLAIGPAPTPPDTASGTVIPKAYCGLDMIRSLHARKESREIVGFRFRTGCAEV